MMRTTPATRKALENEWVAPTKNPVTAGATAPIRLLRKFITPPMLPVPPRGAISDGIDHPTGAAAARAFRTQAYPHTYPAWMKKLRQSAGWISSVAMAQALQRPSSVRLASLRKMVLNLAKACSIGSRSGL